jgi:hypothetical protein
MSSKVFLDWLRLEIVVNHNSYVCARGAIRLLENRRRQAVDENDEPRLVRLETILGELRKYPDDASLLSIQFREEAKQEKTKQEDGLKFA